MKKIIKINLKSIKKNHNAGKTTDHIYVGQTITFYGEGEIPEILKDEKNCIITATNFGFETIPNYEGVILNGSFINESFYNAVKSHNLTIKTTNNYQTIDHLPEPKYLYEYQNVKVKCDYCGKTFYSDNFLEIEYDNHYSLTGCPHCKVSDCCDIIYETIEQALKIRKWKNHI